MISYGVNIVAIRFYELTISNHLIKKKLARVFCEFSISMRPSGTK